MKMWFNKRDEYLLSILRGVIPHQHHHMLLDAVKVIQAVLRKRRYGSSSIDAHTIEEGKMVEILQILQGREVVTKEGVIVFGSDSQIGDVTIRDAAGRDITTINITLVNDEAKNKLVDDNRPEIMAKKQELEKYRRLLRAYRNEYSGGQNTSFSPAIYRLGIETSKQIQKIKIKLRLSGCSITQEVDDDWVANRRFIFRSNKITLDNEQLISLLQQYQDMFIYYEKRVLELECLHLLLIEEETIEEIQELRLIMADVEDIVSRLSLILTNSLHEIYFKLTTELTDLLIAWKATPLVIPNVNPDDDYTIIFKNHITSNKEYGVLYKHGEYRKLIDALISEKVKQINHIKEAIIRSNSYLKSK